MRRYETEFKFKVVKSFLDGDGGAKLLAGQLLVPEEKIRTWLNQDTHSSVAISSDSLVFQGARR